MSFKPLFSRALGAAPGRLHLAAHSHHLWPDASFAGQVACWDDAASLADRKWDKVMGEVWPAAQAEVAIELGHGQADRILFATNTHDFILRLAAACPRRDGTLRVLTSDGEFHSARRQFARWAEDDGFEVQAVPAEPFDSFGERFLAAAQAGRHDLIFVSQMLFGSGRRLRGIDTLASLARPEGPWVVVDGYHSFMAVPQPFAGGEADRAFYLGGGYKYAMAGEGAAFLSCPPGFGPRPPLTGWYGEFAALQKRPGEVAYADDAMRFMGATFDPSALYRFLAVRGMLAQNGLGTDRISAFVTGLQEQLLEAIAGSALGEAELLNPPALGDGARFLAFRDPRAARWCAELMAQDIVTDVRGDVLRIGLGLYHDDTDIARAAPALRALA